MAQAIIDLKVPYFGESLKNKGDSRSCLFDPRKLLSSPKILEHIGKKIAHMAKTECRGGALIGMATSGIAWAAVASFFSDLPMLYVRKKLEKQMSSRYIEGIPPKDKKLILVDDLLFAGESKSEAIEIIHEHGFKVTDVIVIIDRQLQRKKDGPSIQNKYHLKLHVLITMSEIVEYMVKNHSITELQLSNLVDDYQRFERWEIPTFAKKAANKHIYRPRKEIP